MKAILLLMAMMAALILAMMSSMWVEIFSAGLPKNEADPQPELATVLPPVHISCYPPPCECWPGC